MISRASTSLGTPASMAAIVTEFCFRRGISSSRHQARDRSGRWDTLKVLGISSLGASPARCPFGHDPKRTAESLCPQATPEFGSAPAAGRPLSVEPWQVCVEGALPNPEDVIAFATDHLPNQLPAVAGPTDNLLDAARHPSIAPKSLHWSPHGGDSPHTGAARPT